MLFQKLAPKDRHTPCSRCNYSGCCSPTLAGHLKFQFWLAKQNLKKMLRKRIANLTALDYSKIDDVEVDGIDTRDYPDFCDAYIASATYKGRDMTEKELDRLNEDSDYVYEAVQNRLY